MSFVNNLILKCIIYFLLYLQQSCERDIEESCKTCRKLVEKFHEGMENTAKNHFGGGDTAWEESRLGSYARSETRLLDILETVCKGASEKGMCHAMVEEYEEELEHFWFKKQNQLSELEDHLCISVAKVCCPSGKYGENCSDCSGGSSNPCHGRGKCNGNGTRAGTGECDCDSEYIGDLCDECGENYYDASYLHAGNITCEACHETCESSCTNGTNTGCDLCKDGYIDNDDGNGCVDIDECVNTTKCEVGKFCINEKGSYRCNDCDPSCANGCTGTGSVSCNECNPGWVVSFYGGCIDVDECQGEHNCDVGKYCVNKDGSYTCEQCHIACSGGCTSEGPSSCIGCATGYKLGEEGCVDIDECKESILECPLGQTCVNKPGPDSCEPCYKDCHSCLTTDANGCLICKTGYELGENGCEDIDECKSNPCKITGEKCLNSPGSYSCKCKKGWIRTKKNYCKKKLGPMKKEKKEEQKEKEEDSDEDTRAEL